MLELLAVAHEAAAHGAEHHAAPTAFGIGPGGFVALAMLTVFAIMLWKRVPALIGKSLDAKIAGIREQLDTAAKLRDEAAALKAEYEAKAKAADAEIAELKAAAEKQAADIVARAKDDASALIARHKALSADKIAAAERAAVEELRAKAASAAAAAAGQLISQQHDAAADKKLVDQAISGL
jgi:F-type H+-transporting ATPase subunit b